MSCVAHSAMVAYGGVALNCQNWIGWLTTLKSIEPVHAFAAVGRCEYELARMPRTWAAPFLK